MLQSWAPAGMYFSEGTSEKPACCLYRFVTKAELEKLGIGHLVGTRLLRAYMHGFFLHNRLWNKARAIAEPFMYDSYRKDRVTEKLEAERKSRIGLKRKLPRVRAVLVPQSAPSLLSAMINHIMLPTHF